MKMRDKIKFQKLEEISLEEIQGGENGELNKVKCVFRIQTVKLKIPGKLFFKSRMQNFCYIQVIVKLECNRSSGFDFKKKFSGIFNFTVWILTVSLVIPFSC